MVMLEYNIRNDNYFPLKTQALEQDSNPNPEPLQAASSEDQGDAHPRFLEAKPPQAEAKSNCLKGKASQT
ncbi:hypothetical protein DSO57_1019173 [Entomophthora muscae]|uniref:Uncharacterized protein n=1 Tax=Entomophthora muscae TaxID=34485 RepID=A0ACC2TRN0_9FUNG|nr:hypothetical protein DSO57_1019173 [Entomophthora muscae]